MLKIAALRAVPAFVTNLGGIAHSFTANNVALQIGVYSMSISGLSLRAAAKSACFDPSILSLFFGLFLRSLHPSINPDIAETCAWKVFLPVSLSLGILGTAGNKQQDSGSFEQSLQSVLVAFLFGTLGSLAGASINILLSRLIISSKQSFVEVSRLATCLAASYIGGTANFFETAAALQLQARQQLRLLAVADIGVMAVYFSILLSVYRRLSVSTVDTQQMLAAEMKPTLANNSSTKYLPYVASSCLALLIAFASNHIQSVFSHVPGLAVLCVTFMSATIAVQLQKDRSEYMLSSLMQKSSGLWLGMFYAALGMALKPSDLLSLHPSSALLFPVILTCHLTLLLSLSWLWIRISSSRKLDVAAVLVASNACVGGSATAASMAVLFDRSDLILPGCIAGVIGYAIGTPLSLALYGLLVK